MIPQDPNQIEELLRRRVPRQKAPPGFQEQVMRAVERTERPSHEAPRAASLPWSRWAVAAAVVSGALGLVWQNARHEASPGDGIKVAAERSAPPPQPLPPLPLEKVAMLSSVPLNEWTAKLNEPLEKELELMIKDTRQAIQFVASNFLPEDR